MYTDPVKSQVYVGNDKTDFNCKVRSVFVDLFSGICVPFYVCILPLFIRAKRAISTKFWPNLLDWSAGRENSLTKTHAVHIVTEWVGFVFSALRGMDHLLS